MEGQTVRLQTPQAYNRTGVVKEICKEPRSYLIHTEGKLYRRNRRHILPVSEPAPAQLNLSDTWIVDLDQKTTILDKDLKQWTQNSSRMKYL